MRYLTLVTLLVVALLLGSDRAGAAPASQACLPVTEGDGITLTGPAGVNTPPFELAGGSYLVRWSASKGPTMPLGNVILSIKRVDGGIVANSGLVNRVIGQGEQAISGETFVYGLKAGAHYLDVMSPGEWTVTIAPIS